MLAISIICFLRYPAVLPPQVQDRSFRQQNPQALLAYQTLVGINDREAPDLVLTHYLGPFLYSGILPHPDDILGHDIPDWSTETFACSNGSNHDIAIGYYTEQLVLVSDRHHSEITFAHFLRRFLNGGVWRNGVDVRGHYFTNGLHVSLLIRKVNLKLILGKILFGSAHLALSNREFLALTYLVTSSSWSYKAKAGYRSMEDYAIAFISFWESSQEY